MNMVQRFFNALEVYRGGIIFTLIVLGSVALLVQWFAWIFAKGRFKTPDQKSGTGTGSGTSRAELRYIFSEATVKVINDFRHLLALVIVLIFGGALTYSLVKAAALPTSPDHPSAVDNMKDALQAVVATLGGLVGSIIGYYFGESSVAKTPEPKLPTPTPDAEPIAAPAIPTAEEPRTDA